MSVSALDRAKHIKEAVEVLKRDVGRHTLATLTAAPLEFAGFKYLLQVISEASRDLPAEWKREFGPDVDWKGVAGLGNILRHAYHSAYAGVLWDIYTDD